VQDATIACAYAQLAATALGLATTWLGATIDPEATRNALGLTEDFRPLVIMPLGYPDENPRFKRLRSLQNPVRETEELREVKTGVGDPEVIRGQ